MPVPQFKQGEFAYANHTCRFLACPTLQSDHRFALAGIPWDGCVTNRPGARFGPQEIRRASLMLVDGVHPLFDVSPLHAMGDAGDMKLPNASGLEAARRAIEAAAQPLFKSHHPIFLGGDHSVTLPLLRAASAQCGPLALVHFDAHCDTWADHFAEKSGHGTWTREAIEEGLIDPKSTVQIGIRSSAEREARQYVTDHGGVIYSAHTLRGVEGPHLMPIVRTITERIGARACYLSFDIDCLDPAFAPGTGTPEPGGLTTTQALALIEGLSTSLNTIGMDLCEVSPAYDHAELTSQAAAHLVWTYMCGTMVRDAVTLEVT